MMLPKPIDLAQQLVSQVVSAGDTVVDATLGNGHDAFFLSQLVGESGQVIGFDVQQQAIASSQALFEQHAVSASQYTFYCAGHEGIEEYVCGGVAAVMFNLGYLPSADKSVITQTETTLVALKSALRLVRVGGVVSVMCYPGHAGGDVEAASVRKWVMELKRSHYRTFVYQMLNAPHSPPFLILVEKVKEEESKGRIQGGKDEKKGICGCFCVLPLT